MATEKWYLVQVPQGIFRMKAATAWLASQKMTHDFHERVIGVELDEEQHDNPAGDDDDDRFDGEYEHSSDCTCGACSMFKPR